jgi:hypothetical protein
MGTACSISICSSPASETSIVSNTSRIRNSSSTSSSLVSARLRSTAVIACPTISPSWLMTARSSSVNACGRALYTFRTP